jgi:hypothetical protein
LKTPEFLGSFPTFSRLLRIGKIIESIQGVKSYSLRSEFLSERQWSLRERSGDKEKRRLQLWNTVQAELDQAKVSFIYLPRKGKYSHIFNKWPDPDLLTEKKTILWQGKQHGFFFF